MIFSTRNAVPLLGLAALAALGLAAKPAAAQTTLFTDTRVGSYAYTVPTGVTSLFVQLYGAGGGGFASPGGSGAFVSGDLSVFGGETLQLLVGGGGGGNASGGFGGGGSGTFGGGGGSRSAISQVNGSGPGTILTELVDAGGGGGGSNFGNGGDGGSVGGNGGGGNVTFGSKENGGGGGTQTSGGSGGNGIVGGSGSGSSGSLYMGGTGTAAGGGGGFYGGGGGGGGYSGGGGGGGSSYTSSFQLTNVLVKDGGGGQGRTNVGDNGKIILSNDTPAPASAAPEPSQFAGLGMAVLGVGGLVLRARKRKAVAG